MAKIEGDTLIIGNHSFALDMGHHCINAKLPREEIEDYIYCVDNCFGEIWEAFQKEFQLNLKRIQLVDKDYYEYDDCWHLSWELKFEGLVRS